MFDDREPNQFELAPELSALERQLSHLTPAAPRLDRDHLMFAAGQAAALSKIAAHDSNKTIAATLRVAGARHWFWPAATFAMTAASLMLATMLAWQDRNPNVVQKATSPAITEVVDEPRDTTTDHRNRFASKYDPWKVTPESASGYLGIRYTALTKGVGSLTPDFTTQNEVEDRASKPANARDLLNELLPESDPLRQTRS